MMLDKRKNVQEWAKKWSVISGPMTIPSWDETNGPNLMESVVLTGPNYRLQTCRLISMLLTMNDEYPNELTVVELFN